MIDINDPRITAYALGEMDEAEKGEFEKQLKDSPQARTLIAEIQSLGSVLRDEFAREKTAGLTTTQREAITAKASEKTRIVSLSTRRRNFVFRAMQVAALLLVGFIGGYAYFLPSRTMKDVALVSSEVKKQVPLALTVRPDGTAQAVLSKEETGLSISKNHGLLDADGDSSAGNYVLDGRAKVAESKIDLFYDLTEGNTSQGEIFRTNAPATKSMLYTRGGERDLMHAKGAAPSRQVNYGYFAGTADVGNFPVERYAGNENFAQSDLSARGKTEAYDRIVDNPFLTVRDNPLSTFSIDVDTASYSNIRRMLQAGQLPPKDAVRIEEMINYFSYDYPQPYGDDPFSVNLVATYAPWAPEHLLVRVGLKGREIENKHRPHSNLVFLIDVSGSMNSPNKLPLVKDSLRLLVRQLGGTDRVAMVVYASTTGLVLPSTTGADQRAILDAIERLEAGGSTDGGSGIQLAYDTATQNFIQGGINRVILCTDGDFNVGITNEGDLTRLIEDRAKSGVFLTVLGFGMGNYKDSTLEKLADKGNGNYAYIDTQNEARKVLVEQMSGTLVTIAKDVKIQVEFNPVEVAGYRLIGYENRILAKEDFNDDTKDAGEIGAGHTVTALYEVIPAGHDVPSTKVEDLKYQTAASFTKYSETGEMLTVKLRYKKPDGDTSKLLEYPLPAEGDSFEQASEDFRFAAAVASLGMVLRDSQYKGASTLDDVLAIAQGSVGKDTWGYRSEFVSLVEQAKQLSTPAEVTAEVESATE